MSKKPKDAERSFALIAGARSAWPAFLAARDALAVAIQERLAAASLPDMAWYDVLWALEYAPDQRMRMSELADAAIIARSNLTRLVDRMEKAGLVERQRASSDRRGAYAAITADGLEMRKQMWLVYGPAVEALFDAHLSEGENAMVRDIMVRLLKATRNLA